MVSDVWSIGEGKLATADAGSGLFTVAFRANLSVPVPEPWTAEGWSPVSP